MKWFKAMLVLALVSLWTLASMHCKLEELPGLQFLACCDHQEAAPHQDDDCQKDGCAMVEDGLYKSDNPQVTLPAPPLVVIFTETESVPLRLTAPRFSARFLDTRAPEIPVTWHFVSRTALPPRAPSFVS